MKLAKVGFSNEFFMEIVTKGWYAQMVECTEGIPEGSTFQYTYADDETGVLYIVFHHESLADLPLGADIPNYTKTMFRKSYYREVEDLLNRLRNT